MKSGNPNVRYCDGCGNKYNSVYFTNSCGKCGIYENISTGYLEDIFLPGRYTKVINAVKRYLTQFKKKQPFDAIAFTGLSGAAIAFPISTYLKIPLICIRKEKSHSRLKIEGLNRKRMKYIIIDDFVDSGRTCKRIVSTIRNRQYSAECVGIILYGDSDTPPICIGNGVWMEPKCVPFGYRR